MKRIPNYPLLVASLIAIVLFCPALYSFYRWQINRTANVYYEQAETLCLQGNWTDSIDYYVRYIELRPGDAKARIQLAKAYLQAYDGPLYRSRSIDLLFKALGVASSEQETRLRIKLADLLLQENKFKAAETEARRIIASNDEDPAAWRILAVAVYKQLQTKDRPTTNKSQNSIVAILDKAIKLNPSQISLYFYKSQLYGNHERLLSTGKQIRSLAEYECLSDAVMDQMIAAAPKNPLAYLTRYRHRTKFDMSRAEEDLQQAILLGPDVLEILLTAGKHHYLKSVLHRQNNMVVEDEEESLLAARDYYERAIKAAPKDERGYLGVGEIYLIMRMPIRAMDICQSGLKQCGDDNIMLNSCLGEAFIAQGRLEEANNVLHKIRRARANSNLMTPIEVKKSWDRGIDLLNGYYLCRGNEPDKAIPILKRITLGTPITPDEIVQIHGAWLLLGEIYRDMGSQDRAADAYERASVLQQSDLVSHLAVEDDISDPWQSDQSVYHCMQALDISAYSNLWLLFDCKRKQQASRSLINNDDRKVYHKTTLTRE